MRPSTEGTIKVSLNNRKCGQNIREHNRGIMVVYGFKANYVLSIYNPKKSGKVLYLLVSNAPSFTGTWHEKIKIDNKAYGM